MLPLRCTCLHVDNAVRIVSGDKAVLQQQALVVVATVVNEHLLVALCPGDASYFIASRLIVETRFHLQGHIQEEDFGPPVSI